METEEPEGFKEKISVALAERELNLFCFIIGLQQQ